MIQPKAAEKFFGSKFYGEKTVCKRCFGAFA